MSIATTIASITHAVLVVAAPGIMEAIFGTAITFLCLRRTAFPVPSSQHASFFIGGVEAAVSVIVCSMSVIIPAILRAMGVGDPFMQEDTVDLNFSTEVDIARFELGLPITCGAVTVITDSGETEGAFSMMALQRRDLADVNVEIDKKHRLTAQVSDGSLGSSKTTKCLPLTDGQCDITHPMTQARSLPAVMGQGVEADVEEKHAKRNTT